MKWSSTAVAGMAITLLCPITAHAKTFSPTGIGLIDFILAMILILICIAGIWAIGGGVLFSICAVISVPLSFFLKLYKTTPKWIFYPIVLFLSLLFISYLDSTDYSLLKNFWRYIIHFGFHSQNTMLRLITIPTFIVLVILASWIVKFAIRLLFVMIFLAIGNILSMIVSVCRWSVNNSTGRVFMSSIIVVSGLMFFYRDTVDYQAIYAPYQMAISGKALQLRKSFAVDLPHNIYKVREMNKTLWDN